MSLSRSTPKEQYNAIPYSCILASWRPPCRRLPSTALARIKLITLPVRERVEIQLDNPNATLVEEERIVPLVKGVNQVDFSWANTQIDPNTIVFRVIPRVEPARPKAGKPKPGRATRPSRWT